MVFQAVSLVRNYATGMKRLPAFQQKSSFRSKAKAGWAGLHTKK